LPGCGADVLCLQEVIAATDPQAPPWLRYVDPFRDLAQRGDLFGDVSGALPGHRGWFAAAARGPLVDAQGREWATQHGLGLWTALGISVASCRSGFVHGRFRAEGWGPEPVPRAMQVARLWLPGRGFVLAGQFHGLRDPAGKGPTPARATQTAAALALLSAARQAGDLVILCGDFNLLPDDPFFDLARRQGLTDLVTSRGHCDTRTTLYPKAGRYADYLLISDPGAVLRFDVPDQPLLSDHRPLILEL
jgi:hypothetical protein